MDIDDSVGGHQRSQMLIWLATKHLRTSFYVKRHNDIIKWKHCTRYWSFARGIHRSPVDFPQKGKWRGALMFSLIREQAAEEIETPVI